MKFMTNPNFRTFDSIFHSLRCNFGSLVRKIHELGAVGLMEAVLVYFEVFFILLYCTPEGRECNKVTLLHSRPSGVQ